MLFVMQYLDIEFHFLKTIFAKYKFGNILILRMNMHNIHMNIH